jgi:cystathionine beta-synthase
MSQNSYLRGRQCLDTNLIQVWIITVTDKEAFLTTREVVRKEGLLVGGSGGAAVHVVKKLLKDLEKDDVVVIITPDGSQKYFSKIFNDDWMEEKGFLN